TVKQMSHLYPSFQAGATKAAQSAVAKAGGPKKASAAGKFFALSKMSVPAFRSANAAFLAPNLTFPVGKFADTSVEADHYYQYQVIPILKRNLVAGNGAKSTPVGVPAVAKVPAPAVTLTDAIAPKLLQFKAASTNVLKLQATHGIFEPNSLVASKDSVSHGAALSQNLVAARSKVLLSSPAGPRNLVAAGALHPVAANYGRMVTVSWAAPNYTSACSFKVYRANGTGYTSNVSAENIPTSLASASAEDQGTKAGGNRAVAPSLPQARKTVTTTIQNPKAVAAGLPKQKSALSGIGAFRNVNARILFSLDTSPPLAAYALLGQTAPGATQFIDLIPRSQSNTFYYYVVPVNRWGMTGTPSSPAKVKTLPSLPPSVPVLMAVSPTETQSLSATVQPNIVPEDVVEYRLYRMPFPVNALITAPNGRAVLTGGRLTGNTNAKSSSIMVSKTFGNRVLVAKGAGLAGGAKFGILQTQSPAASLGQYQSLVKASLINKSTTPAMPLELQALFPLANYTQVGSTKANPTSTDPVAIADPGAAPGVEYVYRVVAVDSAGLTSEPSTVMDAMALKLWCDPPTQSGQASYSAATNTVSFALAPPATGCAAFVIERAIDAGATKFVQVKILAANGATPVSFSDTAVRPGQTYTYRVSAIDAAGNSSKRTGTTDNAGGVLTIVVKT
ncbi:MAG TPA: hypothetical protein VKT78_17260, partial [Fimbriimonadaceae bacterium]|nr:hypothetical protein [Fimbriimonadaceae bacterium]